MNALLNRVIFLLLLSCKGSSVLTLWLSYLLVTKAVLKPRLPWRRWSTSLCSCCRNQWHLPMQLYIQVRPINVERPKRSACDLQVQGPCIGFTLHTIPSWLGRPSSQGVGEPSNSRPMLVKSMLHLPVYLMQLNTNKRNSVSSFMPWLSNISICPPFLDTTSSSQPRQVCVGLLEGRG